MVEMDIDKANELLKTIWDEISKIPKDKLNETRYLDDVSLVAKIKKIINGKTKSYKYALLTQVLAKAVNPSVNTLALQKQSKLPYSFDARSFCKKVVVKFERECLHNVLGKSDDPYVSKPLRHSDISLKIINHIKDKEGWRILYDILFKVEEKKDREFTLDVLRQILLEIRKYLIEIEEELNIVSKRPAHISSAKLGEILKEFLSKPSLGARPQAIVYALMRTLNRKLGYFGKVTGERSTVADEYSKRFADIECFDHYNKLKVGIAVTENLTDSKLKEELNKATEKGLDRIIILANKIDKSLDIEQIVKGYSNVDVVVENLINFVQLTTTLFDDELRKEFIDDIGEVLKEMGYYDHLKDWLNIRKRLT
jgi:hypothetical protein